VQAQEQRSGPVTPPPEHKVVRIPTDAAVAPPPVPAEEIIRHATQAEDDLFRAQAGFTFRKSIRVQEFGEDGTASGEFQMILEPAVNSDGKRYEKVFQENTSTLRQIKLEREDVELLAHVAAFVLTTDQLPKYELTYAGKQPVDELTTYLFRVKPRHLERKHAYFEGLIWVDDRDLVIVKTYGKWVTETGDVTPADVPFTMFEVYRENIEGKRWVPSYLRSDDYLKTKRGDVHVRLTVRWTDYKPIATAK
jgi:hypothetical protein